MSDSNPTIYVLSAPSGAGKTSMVAALIKQLPEVVVAVSHTTRPKRKGDVDGQDYHFVSREEFEALIESGSFLEHASVFENYYGTSQSEVERCIAAGNDVILEIDWQGAAQVRERLPGVVSIFILPPSREILLQRLQGRGTDSEEVIARRTREAVEEMRHHQQADYLLINDDFEETLNEFKSILVARRVRIGRQCRVHDSLLSSLLGSGDTPATG